MHPCRAAGKGAAADLGRCDEGCCHRAQRAHHRSVRIALLAPSQPTCHRCRVGFANRNRRVGKSFYVGPAFGPDAGGKRRRAASSSPDLTGRRSSAKATPTIKSCQCRSRTCPPLRRRRCPVLVPSDKRGPGGRRYRICLNALAPPVRPGGTMSAPIRPTQQRAREPPMPQDCSSRTKQKRPSRTCSSSRARVARAVVDTPASPADAGGGPPRGARRERSSVHGPVAGRSESRAAAVGRYFRRAERAGAARRTWAASDPTRDRGSCCVWLAGHGEEVVADLLAAAAARRGRAAQS
jgi:hypothetical protein